MHPAFRTILINLASGLLFAGCVHNYYVKENLSPNQVVETSIIRKPSLVKSRIILPRYDDYLEGYIRGQLMTKDGKPLQGVVVKVLDKKGADYSGFISGVSNSSGVYKVRFSQPVIWKRVDIEAFLSFESGWRALGKKTRFRLYFNRRSGDLVFTPEENVLVLENEAELKKSLPWDKKPAPKKSDSLDPFNSPSPSKPNSPGAKPAAEDDPFADFDL